MQDFFWNDWNLQKIDNHALSMEEVEFAWHNRTDVYTGKDRLNGTYWESLGQCPSGRWITIVWRYNQVVDRELVFVITAY